jgi:hypothetical protein
MCGVGIPNAITPTWDALREQVVRLHLQWRLHEELFVKEERRKLLDEVAGTFFGLVQQNFLLDVQLAIARLGDPAQQGSNSNITLHKLAAEIRALYQEPLDPPVQEFFAALARALAAFALASEKVRERRNKYFCPLRLRPCHGEPSRPNPYPYARRDRGRPSPTFAHLRV